MAEVAEGIIETDRDLRIACVEVKAQVQGCACRDREMIEEGGIHWKLVDSEPLQVWQGHHSVGQGHHLVGRNTEVGRGCIAEYDVSEKRCVLEEVE